MKAVFKARPAPGFEVLDAEVPQIGDNDLLVKIKATSVCGTDVHIWKWDEWARKRIHPPRIIGHEFAGEVAEVGKNASGFEKGDLVSGETHINCGYCFQCRTGSGHICENVSLRGIDSDGCFAEYLKMPANTAWKNDPSLPLEVMSAQEPLGNAVHTVFSGEVAGQSVVVLGCGPIGMCAVALCREAGAEKIFAVDVNDYRLDLAKKLTGDADNVFYINSAKQGSGAGASIEKQILEKTKSHGGADVVLEMSGNAEALKTGFRVLRPGGRMSILGVFAKPVELDVTDGIVFKAARVNGVNGRLMFDTWFKSSAFLKTGKIKLDRIVTHRFKGLDKMNSAVEVMASGQSGKVVVFP